MPFDSNTMDYDVIVAGSGIAGLSFALKVADAGFSICIVTKKGIDDSNTNHAQGGIACVTSGTDDFEKHIADTMTAGAGLCDREVVRQVVSDGPARIREIVNIGVEFSRLDDGQMSLGREGGHSERRILHVEDMTGRAIETALVKAVLTHPRIEMREHMVAVDLITQRKLWKLGYGHENEPDRVMGLYAYNEAQHRVETLRAPVVMLATGGIGGVYLYTTNPPIATGDGIAMAYRAGAKVGNLEFMQFHPTTLMLSDGETFLISEALRGYGGVIIDKNGNRLMESLPMKDLSPRDIVARTIDRYLK
ncbi:MAG TPA: FAD-binding protein, partial [Opitutales bacterium]|nr:FAD-binding protein [Opitutales bacterium]